jgi:molecular chaperone DnaK (HSP70)
MFIDCDHLSRIVLTQHSECIVNGGGYPRVDIDGRKYTPQEISAMVLQKYHRWK